MSLSRVLQDAIDFAMPQILTTDAYGSLVRLLEAHHHTKHGCLARTTGTNQGYLLSWRYINVHALENLAAAVAFGKPSN